MNNASRVEALLFAALEKSNEAERADFLDLACGGDFELRGQVEKLLKAHADVGDFLRKPAVEQLAGALESATATQAFDPSTDHEGGNMTRSVGERAIDDDNSDLGFLQPPTRPDSLGRLGHYDVLQVLGRGGFGIVFRAFDDMLQRVVALKVMAPQLAATSPARKRFLREARSSAQVRHENVVQVYEVAEQPLPYLAMEFIPGETLQQRLDRVGPLDVPETLRIGRQLAEGLAAAHATDLIHRDIKPGNVLLEGGQHKAKITDFGLARAADDASISQSGIIAGTPMYMAPEQAEGKTLDQRADLFSLGSVLYQMVAGRPPFRANSTLSVLKRVAEDKPRAIREIIPETPQWLCDIIAKLHAKSPDDRYQSAREVADVLADCEAQLKANSKLKDYSRIPRSKPQRSGRRKWVAAAMVLVALAGVGLYALTRPGPNSGGPGTEPPRSTAVTWGETVDPLGDCRFTEENGRLTITVPGDRMHDLNPLPGCNLNSPRVLREVAGDFEARVTVLPYPRPTSLDSTGPNPPYVGAGLVVWSDEASFLRLFRANTEGARVQAEWYSGPTPGGQKWIPVPDGPMHLRIRRTGDTLHLASSADGQTWTEVATADNLRPAPRVRVGVAVVNAIKQEFTVQFEGFEIKELPPTFKNSIGMEFVIVPKGKSWLGGGKDKVGDKEVDIPADFYLGKYEVTQEEWTRVMGETPGYFTRTGGGKDEVKDIPDAELRRFPVDGVSWEMSQIFVAKLNQREKETGWVYRLPTETEWEYACRGGAMANKADSAFDFYFARPTNTLLPGQANFASGLNRTCKVGSYEPNVLGLHDMHGNVHEWCDDLDKTADGVDGRVLRGGGYRHDAWICRAGFRYSHPPTQQIRHLGLRLARVPSSAPSPEVKTPPLVKREPLSPTFKNSIGMEFVIVPKGKSWLGGSKDKLGDQEVWIPADFYLGKYEVTQEEWTKVMGENPSHFSRTGGGKDAVKDILDADLKRFPVESVSWEQCQLFVAKLNKLEKETGWVYRLPTHAEWEYACRGGPMTDKADSAFDFYFARPTNSVLPEQANFNKGLNRTCKVGSYEPNRLGLFDMHGNAWECCDDTAIAADGISLRVGARGSCWAGSAASSRAANRSIAARTYRDMNQGFRVARVPSSAPSPEAKTPPLAIAPFTDADVQRIAALPAAEQVEEVRKELMRRNPGFDGKMDTKIEGGVVTVFQIVNDQVTDIAPIRVWNALRVLKCAGTQTNGKRNGLLADLTPLEGMNLAGLTHLNLGNTKVSDAGLVHFKDCKNLTELLLFGTQLSDAGLAHFKDCKSLTELHLDNTRVSDTGLAHFKDCKNLSKLRLINTKVSEAGLAHFKGMPLKVLWICNTGITDLTSLQGMPLEGIRLTPKNITRGLDILRDMKSLKTIGLDWNQAWPAAEFWERFDKGEFGKAADNQERGRRDSNPQPPDRQSGTLTN